MAHDVFISYASEDAAISNRMCEYVEAQGIKCWIAPRDVKSGEDYPKAIIRAIIESDLLILVFSESSMSSNHVTSEVLKAFNQGYPIIAVRVEDIEPNEQMEYLLSTKHWLDAYEGDEEENNKKLLEGVLKLLAEKKAGKISIKTGDRKTASGKPARREMRSIAIYAGAVMIFLMTLATMRDDLRGIMLQNLWVPLLIVLVPVLIIIPDLFAHFARHKRKKQIEEVGKSGRIKDPEYFRTFPYETIPDYMKEFRSDKAHEKILKWINKSDEPVLFLSGQSGTGKTSILQAYVSPNLQKQDPPVWTITIRSFAEPLRDLRNELIRLSIIDAFTAKKNLEIRDLLAKAASNAAPGRLLIIFDQFEELLILQDKNPERLEEMRNLLNSLYSDPIKGLTFILSFRSDYLPLLENFDLPDLTTRKNWFEVGAFTESAAREFLKGSNIMFSGSAMKDLFDQIAAFEGTKGLVRPIILNMVGMIVEKSGEREPDARQKKTENLMAEYLRYNLYRRDMKDHAPEILEHMVSDLGTTIPRSVADLMIRTGIPRNEIKGTFNLLANAGLVRQIDQTDDMWEVAHDFIAQYLLLVIRGTRKTFGEIISPWLAPVSLLLWTTVILFFAPPFVSKLSEGGFLDKIFNPEAIAEPEEIIVEPVPEIPPELKIPVELQIDVTAAEGFVIISTEIIPEEVTVEGEDDLLIGIEKIDTDFLDFTGIDEDVAYYVELISPGEGITLKPGIVNIKIDIEPIPVQLPQKEIADIPLEMTEMDEAFDYSINPETVIIMIEGPEDQIEEFDGSSLKIAVDVSSYQEGNHGVPIDGPELPEGFNVLEILPSEIVLNVTEKPEPKKPVEKPKEDEKKKPDEKKTDPVPVEDSSAKGLFETALGKYNKGLYDDAIGIFKKAIEKDPNYRNAWYYRGLAYYKKSETGRYGKQKKDELYAAAITNFTKVIQLKSNDKLAYYYRGLSLMALSKNLQAPVDDFKKFVQLSPRDKLGHYYLGTAFNKKYEWNSAIGAFKDCLKYDMNYKPAYAGLWLAYKSSKGFDAAVTTYTGMIKKNPGAAVGYYYLGLAYEEKGDHAKAVQNIKKALEIYPAYTDASKWLTKAGEM